jgi:nucleoside-diphosphate-sugar epimerase
MKAFVTGGTGFIGSHLVDFLIDSDRYDELRCLIRNREKWLEGKSFQRIPGDLYDMDALRKGMEGVDVVFHLAGLVKAKSWREFELGNVEATENLVRVAQNKGVPKIIILSSLAAAGPSNAAPKEEGDPMEPVSMYGQSKKQMEERVREIADTQTDITIIRPAAVYGPRDEDVYSLFKMASKGLFPIIGDGKKPKISLVYVSDVVRSIDLAVQNGQGGLSSYFIANKDIYTWNHIRSVMNGVLYKKNIPIYLKPNWVKKLAGIIEKAASLVQIHPIINRDKANELVLEWTCSTEKAQKELNFHPAVTLEEGFAETVYWYKRHHWL